MHEHLVKRKCEFVLNLFFCFQIRIGFFDLSRQGVYNRATEGQEDERTACVGGWAGGATTESSAMELRTRLV